MKFQKILQAIVLLGGLIGLGGAQASVIYFAGVNDTGSILYSTTQSGANLSATVAFTLNTLSATSATFGVTVSNNSSGAGTNELTSFGIQTINPTLTGASTSQGSAWSAGVDTTLPTFSTVDLCIWSGNNCSGGNIKNGLAEGASSSFLLTLTTAGNFLDGISFTGPYGAKFQNAGTSNNSFEFAGCVVGSPNCGNIQVLEQVPEQVPEPASIALVVLGLLAASLVHRRRA